MSKSLSIPRIIRQHPGESLFVQPLEWTDRHLEVLRCSFEERHPEPLESNGDGVEEEDGDLCSRPFDYYTQAAEDLALGETKNTAMIRLLAGHEGPFKLFRASGFFRYREKYEFRLHGANFVVNTKNKSKSCVFAFMQRRMIRIQRENLYPIGRGRHPNEAVDTLRKRRLDRIEPKDCYRDPYILAVLLGLAQSQAAAEQSCQGGNGHSHGRVYHTAALFVDEDPAFMRLYTCAISASFLRTFEYPTAHQERQHSQSKSAGKSHTTIHYQKISFKPYSTLRQQILDQITPLIADQEKKEEEAETTASEMMTLSGVIFNL